MKLSKAIYTALFAVGVLCVEQLQASPARRQVFTITQPDGTKIQALQFGDEYMSFVTDSETGQCLVEDITSGFWRPMTEDELSMASRQWSESRHLAQAAAIRRNLGGAPKKDRVTIPLLLVEYSNLKLTEKYGTKAFYETLLNDISSDRLAFTDSKGNKYYAGSARKYFNAQSRGSFDPVFEILDPISLDNEFEYYGKDSQSKDINKGKLIEEAVNKAIARGDFQNAAKYDSNKDGRVDLLYIVFAGCGQNQGANSNTIWPHTSTYSIKTPDGTSIYDYCMTNELSGPDPTKPATDGIGIFVHEMSHALGLPDFYATNSSVASDCFGMDAWSLMDQGEFNGRNQIPANYTLHERMMFEWCEEPEPVPSEGIIELEPLVKSGKGLILRNPSNPNEYLTFENHQPEANLWERCWGTSSYFSDYASYLTRQHQGLLITHVDYNASIWNSNGVNNTPTHQRCTPLAADGECVLYSNFTTRDEYYAYLNSLSSDIFPGYSKVTTLNDTNPLAVWYTGEKIDINITNIEQLANGNLKITFGNPKPDPQAIDELKITTKQQNSSKILFRDGRFVINGYDLNGRKIQK